MGQLRIIKRDELMKTITELKAIFSDLGHRTRIVFIATGDERIIGFEGWSDDADWTGDLDLLINDKSALSAAVETKGSGSYERRVGGCIVVNPLLRPGDRVDISWANYGFSDATATALLTIERDE